MNKKGFLVSIEGIDGSGKSSLANALKKRIEQEGHAVLITKEPGGTQLGQHLRVLLHEEKKHICDKAEYLLFAADRAQHFEQIIIPALKEGKIIISDRLDDSSIAYQGYGRQLDISMIHQVNQWAKCNINQNITFYLKLDLQTALQRIMLRGNKLTSFEIEQELFWKRVIDGFETLFKNRADSIILDGNKSIEILTEQATEHVFKQLQSHK